MTDVNSFIRAFQANAKLESWRTEMSRNWIRDVNSRQMMNINDEEAAGDGPESEDKDTRIGTWSSKDLDAFAASTRQKFSSVENLAAPSDGTEMWTDSGNGIRISINDICPPSSPSNRL